VCAGGRLKNSLPPCGGQWSVGRFQDGFLPPVRVLHVGLAARVRFSNPWPLAWFFVGRGFADEAV